MATADSASPFTAKAAPSIALQISKKDGERFLQASRALQGCLIQQETSHQQENVARNASEATSDESQQQPPSAPLHKRLLAAARQCDNPLVAQFLERVTSSLSQREVEAATLLFYEKEDKSAKLRHLFSILSSSPDAKIKTEAGEAANPPRSPSPISPSKSNADELTRTEALALFRTVLTAISACLHQTQTDQPKQGSVIVEGKLNITNSPERPFKKTKLNHDGDAGTVSTKAETEDESCRMPSQSPSWDSSLTTTCTAQLNHSEDEQLRKEIEDVASFAAGGLFDFVQTKKGEEVERIDFSAFGNWYNTSGGQIVPWIELLQISKWKAPSSSKKEAKSEFAAQSESESLSPGSLATEEDSSRTMVSFDFNGSGSPVPLVIDISHDNLHALRSLVQRTHLVHRSAADMVKLLQSAGCRRSVHGQDFMVLCKEDFKRTIRTIMPEYVYAQLSRSEKDAFGESFFDFFSCFEEGKTTLHEGEVDLKEFAVGFCFFCAGNKSTKLATGFDLLDSKGRGYLTEDELLRYLQSYLTMLVAMSLLTPIDKRRRRKSLTSERRKVMRSAIDNGAKWTLGHFLKASGQTKNEYTFESFATWYSEGGYNIAPWLELLDLDKVMSLISEQQSPLLLPPLETSATKHVAPPRSSHHNRHRHRPRDRVSSLRRHHSSRRGPPPEVLFTFPLGNRRSLVILKEDASYVRALVDQLGLLYLKPDDLWSAMCGAVEKRHRPSTHRQDDAIYVNQYTFVESMVEVVCPRERHGSSRKRRNPSSAYGIMSSNEEVLANFFQCFDIDQSDSVALDELMGGLTLLCGGKKSHKLSFAFSIFDTRPGVHSHSKKRGIVHSLSGEDLFLFLRSILIVTFSTCRQSLDMTDDMVGRCIADTANMICNDVMRHQWETKHMDRLDFDEFGQWYNEGGFERAPWLELLDLKKWVLVDDYNIDKHSNMPIPPSQHGAPPIPIASSAREMADHDIPPPPPEDALDNSFFDTDAIMPMDSMDDMDMILMQSSGDKDDFSKIPKSFSLSPRQQQQPPARASESKGNPLKFHLNTTDEHGGYMLSLSQARIRHFRELLEASGLHKVTSESACNKILANGTKTKTSKKEFMAVVQALVPANGRLSENMQKLLTDIFGCVFSAFDRDGTEEANPVELACGFTVLCRGKKSDKLEFAFEVLDKNKRGQLSKSDMASYLQSFLSVLLSVAFSPSLDNDRADDTCATMNGTCSDRTTTTLIQAAKTGAAWAASLAFADYERNKKRSPSMSFDDFADWYTAVGYSSIPWLELLDLQKWAMNSDNTK